MATTLTSTIINVNIAKLKRDIEALGDIKVLSIKPKNGLIDTAVTMVRGDGISNLTPAQQVSAQAVIDAHLDQQVENIKLQGETEFLLGTRQNSGEIIFQQGSDGWKFNSSRHLIPLTSGNYNIGSSGNRVNQFFAVTGNFSGDLTVSGNLTVDGTLTYINTTNLNISDNIITLNADWVGAPTEDAGILVERGSSTDAEVLWNETTDKWQAGTLSDLQNIIRQVEFDTHVNNVSNPHAVTKAQVGLSNVTNDAQLKRAAGDFVSFSAKSIPENADVFLIEDSSASGTKKYSTFLQINNQLVHQNLSGAGTNTHAQIDAHIANTSNPHAVTKAQVGLGNVTDDAQLKRAAADFQSFSLKASPTISDFLLIEDDADSDNKKYISIGSLPFSSSGTLDGFPLPGTPVDGQTIKFNGGLSQWDYIEEGVAKKVVTGSGNKSFDATSIPDDAEYLRYDQGLDKIVWAPAPGVSSSGPIGSILPFGGGVVPSGFLLCDGSAISRVFYADLFAIIGTSYGIGDGSTTFNIPDLRGRFPYGKRTGINLGDNDGLIEGSRSQSHTHMGGSHTHDLSNHTHTGGLHTHDMQNHTHSIPAHYHGMGSGADLNITASGAHTHTVNDLPALNAGADWVGQNGTATSTSRVTDSATHTHSSGSFAGRIGLVTGGVDGNSSMTSGSPSTNLTSSDGAVTTSGPSINNTGSAGIVSTTSATVAHQVVNFVIKYSDNLLATGTTNISNIVNFANTITQQTHAGFPNSHVTQRTMAIQTTTNSTATLGSFTVNDNSVAWFEAKITTRFENTGTNKSYWAFIRGGVRRNNAGVAVLVGLPEIIEDSEGSPGYTCDVDVSANDLRIRVTGANETVNWAGKLEFQHVSLAS